MLMNQALQIKRIADRLEMGDRPMILRSCLTLSADKISSAGSCIHQPRKLITRHAEEFGTLMIENRKTDPERAMWSAPAERSVDGALDCRTYGTSYPKRCRTTLATALHMLSPTSRAQLLLAALILGP